MESTELKSKLMTITATAAEYCQTIENCQEIERDTFIAAMLVSLPRIYLQFTETEVPENDEYIIEEENYPGYYPSYVDEDYYESVRRKLETLFGPDDTFLETFEEDMKYSDTPIAASISESLADIFQPLYDFISAVKDSEGENMTGAYTECRENFASYWSQTLCNVLRPLNNLKYNSNPA